MGRLIFVFLVALLSISLVASQGEVTISRDLSNFKVGEAFEVTLDIGISGDLAAVGIEEYAPSGAIIINSSASNFMINENKIEFLLFDSGNPIQNQTLSYFVLLNSSDNNFTSYYSLVEITPPANDSQSSDSSSSGTSSGGTTGSSSEGGGTVSNTSTDNSTTNSSVGNETNSTGGKGKGKNTKNQSGGGKGKGGVKKFFNKTNILYAGVILSIGGIFFIKSIKEY